MTASERELRDAAAAHTAVCPMWAPDDPYAAVYSLTFGDFSRADELLDEDVAARFVRITGAAEVEATEP